MVAMVAGLAGLAGAAPPQGAQDPVLVSSIRAATPPGGVGPAAHAQLDVQKRVASDHRRSNKPIMEKRRRARINNCLNELKTLILDAMKKDPARHSKLEKADILEMTVKHLETLQRQRATATEPLDRYRAGFRECAAEVGRFHGLDPALKRRLLQHLESCVAPTERRPRLLPTPPSEPEDTPQSGIFISAGQGSGVRLVPTRLANGDIALVLPSQSAAIAGIPVSSMPTLIPIPARTSSTASASSSGSPCSVARFGGSSPNGCYSPVSSAAWSPSPPPCSPPEPTPLSLVTRRAVSYEEDALDDKPWRPW